MEQYYDVREAAQRLRTSEDTLWMFIRRGELAHIRLGRRVMVTEKDLDAFMKARRVAATRTPQPA